ncbi:MAG TPA: hypothetical protein VLM11_19855 [Streptosporangiaceae bacterium]|nr:hypothetical protein [Streptosporangiaceae bacterium]
MGDRETENDRRIYHHVTRRQVLGQRLSTSCRARAVEMDGALLRVDVVNLTNNSAQPDSGNLCIQLSLIPSGCDGLPPGLRAQVRLGRNVKLHRLDLVGARSDEIDKE